jgi:DNA repair protein RadA/Sms
VLERRADLHLKSQDIFVNLAGGIKITEPAVDLAVVVSIASAFLKKKVAADMAFFGEVGLSGEIRGVSYPQKRIIEASRLGFKQVVIPQGNNLVLKRKKLTCQIIPVRHIKEALKLFT